MRDEKVDNFKKDLEVLGGKLVSDQMANDFLEEFQEIINYFEDDVQKAKSDADDSESAIYSLQENISELENRVWDDTDIVTDSVISKIRNNLKYIPIDRLEAFVDKYAVV